jgi:dTDP-4-dehydrorhamnose reductase
MADRPVLITGGSGQLAQSLFALAGTRAVRLVGRPDFDFDDPDGIGALLDRVRPGVIVNAAAYTAVDRAETDRDAAWRANAEGPELLARWCAAHDAGLIHISTDYVFDGTKGAPYTESDQANPIGVYGASKRAGEAAVLAALASATVLRTSWVYAAHGKNFVRTMLNAGLKTDRLRVVGDQIGCPTATDDLAVAIWAMVDRPAGESGIFHAAGAGATSWHGFAEAIFDAASVHGRKRPQVDAITTAEWPTPVRRPADSRLDCERLALVHGIRLPDWRASLERVVAAICAPATP